MKLSQFLSTLKGDICANLMDMETGDLIISFKSTGYEGLDEDILNREVKQWEILTTTGVKITLGDEIVTADAPQNEEP